jgi:hypothetical protein
MNEDSETLPLFVYGTLMDTATMDFALGRTALNARPHSPIKAEKAVLSGFQVFTGDRGKGWPYIVPRDGAAAEGQLVSGLSAKDIWRLDIHESVYDPETETRYPLFTRQCVTVIANGREVECDTYMPVFENWRDPNWRSRAEEAETTKIGPVRQELSSLPADSPKARAGS